MNTFRCMETNGIATIELFGVVADDLVNVLKKQLGEYLERDVCIWIFDLKNATYIDSGGLGTIVSHLARCRQMGGDICLSAPNHFLESILHLSGLRNMLIVFENKEQAFLHYHNNP